MIDEAGLTFGICFSVSPGPSFTSRLEGRPPVAPLVGVGLLASGEGIRTGVSLEVSKD